MIVLLIELDSHYRVKIEELKPDTATQRVLAKSAREAREWLMNGLLTYATRHRSGGRWALPTLTVDSETAFACERPNYLDVDARGIGYVTWYAPPEKPGAATDYLATYKDARGDLLRGVEKYKVHVPNVPAMPST